MLKKLKCPDTVQKLKLNLDNKLENLQPNLESVEEKWASFRDADHSAALETLGPATRHHQDWFDENDSEIHSLLEEKKTYVVGPPERPDQCGEESCLHQHAQHSAS